MTALERRSGSTTTKELPNTLLTPSKRVQGEDWLVGGSGKEQGPIQLHWSCGSHGSAKCKLHFCTHVMTFPILHVIITQQMESMGYEICRSPQDKVEVGNAFFIALLYLLCCKGGERLGVILQLKIGSTFHFSFIRGKLSATDREAEKSCFCCCLASPDCTAQNGESVKFNSARVFCCQRKAICSTL